MPKKFKTVPTNASFDAKNNQWELGERDAKGRQIGEWKFWWGTTGHLCAISFFEDAGKKETFTRFHPDGTWSVKATYVNGKPVPGTMICTQRSRNKTTELIMTQSPELKNVFRVEELFLGKGRSKWKNLDEKNRRIDLEGNVLLTPEAYAKNFSGFDLPEKLAQLVDLQNELGIENFAQGFALLADDKGLIKNFCGSDGKPFASKANTKEFLAALMPLADANGTGSGYVVWNDGKSKSIDQMPIVIFGDEGGVFVVAQNLSELLQIVAADIEPSVDLDGVTFYRGADEDGSAQIGAFRKWLKENFGVTAAKKPEQLVRKAQKKTQSAFEAWLKSLS
jgi:hypothetical protein